MERESTQISGAIVRTQGLRRGSIWSNRELQIGLILFAAFVFVPALAGNQYWIFTFLLVTLYAAVAVLQNVLIAEAGQFSLGQGAIFGASAVAVGMVCGLHELPFALGALAGVFAGMTVGVLYALPALRVQGYYLAFATLSAALVFPQLVVAFDSFTGGMNGAQLFLPSLSQPFFLGLSPLAVGVFVLASVILIFHAAMPKTRFGRLQIVAAKSPEAAQSMGVRPGGMRAAAFLLTAFGTSLAGVLYVPLVGFVSPSAFKVDLSILFFFAVVVGGKGKLLGPIFGMLLLYLLPNVLFAEFAQYRLLMYGIAALIVTFVFPDGLLGSIDLWRKRMRRTEPVTGIDFGYVIDKLRSLPAAVPQKGVAVSVKNAVKQYEKLVAIDGVSFTVARGTIHGLVGPNGSGKTTLLNLISGFVRPDAGQVELGDVLVTSQAPWERSRRGLGRTFQTPRIFESLSLWDNLRLGAESPMWRPGAVDILDMLSGREAAWANDQPGLLSHGQRRLLEMIRVMVGQADVILLDEPASGLSPLERQRLAELLILLRDRLGRTIVLVEHDLSLVWNVADEITVLEYGRISAQGTPSEIRRDPHVQALFAGGSENA